MSFMKRISTTLFAQVDQLVGEMENHDALINVAISEQKKKLVTAKLQLARIRSSEQSTAKQLAGLSAAEKQWAQRALSEAEKDETRALMCLERRHQVQQQREKLLAMQEEYQYTAKHIAANVKSCETELEDMVRKHELMRARQSSLDAKVVIDQISNRDQNDLESSFTRWELKLAQGEYVLGGPNEEDAFEEDYLTAERQQNLKSELADLLKHHKDSAQEDGDHENR